MAKTKEQLLNILDQFQLTEKVVSAEPFGNGHINDTLKVTNEKGEIKYVLQRINHLIFTNVDMLQNNIQIVTSHIRKKLEEKGENDMHAIFPKEMQELKKVFMPYIDKKTLKLVDNAPEEAVKALEKFKEIGRELFDY